MPGAPSTIDHCNLNSPASCGCFEAVDVSVPQQDGNCRRICRVPAAGPSDTVQPKETNSEGWRENRPRGYRITATFGPALTLLTCDEFLRPNATGGMEFSARLLGNSTCSYSRHHARFGHIFKVLGTRSGSNPSARYRRQDYSRRRGGHSKHGVRGKDGSRPSAKAVRRRGSRQRPLPWPHRESSGGIVTTLFTSQHGFDNQARGVFDAHLRADHHVI
jgi:hypothetical protein